MHTLSQPNYMALYLLPSFISKTTWSSDSHSEILVCTIVRSKCAKSQQHLEHQKPL